MSTTTFMYDGVKASTRLENLALLRLDKINAKYDFIIGTDVLFKKENTTSNAKGMICSIRISMRGALFFAEASNGTFEESVAEALHDIEVQLQKRKEKLKVNR